MGTFKPRLSLPPKGSPYYNTIRSGGYNPCILGNNDRGQRVEGLNVLPNCVAYATGRFAEIIGEPRCQYLGNTNACNYIALAQRQGLQISEAPTLGGVMVWGGGNGGYGHVASVEGILDNGKRVVTSESEYYGKAFTLYTRSGDNWRNGCYWMGPGYFYLGCIVNPAVPKEDEMTKEERYAEWLEFNNRHAAEVAKLPATNAETERRIQRVKDYGLMGGDPDGNFRPQSPVKREELAITLSNMLPDA